jgi:pimeloyl-ACP methyl ester carboxylesterase
MNNVISRDGTSIACESTGVGPDVVLIGARAENALLAKQLAGQFRVTSYDQRGYGDSGDAQPYAVAREVEDLEAVLRFVGRTAGVYGASAAGALGLEAAAAGLPIGCLAVFEVPYGIKTREEWYAYRENLERHLAAGRRGDAFALFMKIAGSTDAQITQARQSKYWAQCEAIAHTRLYGAEILGDGQVPVDRLSRIGCPVLVLTGHGGDAHMTGLPQGVFHSAAESIAQAINQSQIATIDAGGHEPDPTVMAAELAPFFHHGLAER